MKKILALLGLFAFQSFGITNVTLPYLIDTASIPKVRYVDKNDSALKWGINNLGDTLNAASGTGVLLRSTGPTLAGTLAAVNGTYSGTLGVTGVTTLLGAVGVSGQLTNNQLTGTGTRLVTSTSAGILGNATTIAGANTWSSPQVFSSTLGVTGIATVTDSLLGSTARFTGRLGIGSVAPSVDLHVQKSTSGSSVRAIVENLSNTASSDAFYTATVGGSSAGNAYYRAGDGTHVWVWGNRTSDGNFVLSNGATFNTSNALVLTSAGNATVTGSVTADSIISSKFYTEGTFTAAATGFSACTSGSLSGSTCTATAKYVRIGKAVTLSLPNLSGTSSGTALTITGIPAVIRGSQYVGVPSIQDNGNDYAGYLAFDIFGVATAFIRTSLSATPTGTFTGSGSKGIQNCTLSYTLQ